MLFLSSEPFDPLVRIESFVERKNGQEVNTEKRDIQQPHIHTHIYTYTSIQATHKDDDHDG